MSKSYRVEPCIHGNPEARFSEKPSFTGWAGKACGWAKPIPRIVESDGEPPRDIETDFANHDRAKHPLKGEDFS